MIMDLHNHTVYSYDGSDTPERVIEHAIENGVDVVGITDHQFSIGRGISGYKEHILKCKKKYDGQIKVLAGLEIGTRPAPNDLLTYDIDGLDYVLFESLDDYRAMDFYEFIAWRRRFRCPVGLAHCDIFAMSERYGINIPEILKQENIFWEINTSGNYNYYYDFLTNSSKRNAVKQAGIGVSVGSDTHSIVEYRKKQLIRANELIEEMGLAKPFNI